MNIQPVLGTQERTLGWFVYADQQWTDLFGDCNWYDMTLVHLGGEWSRHMGRWEVEVGLLGFNLRITYVYDDAPIRKLLDMREEYIARTEVEP